MAASTPFASVARSHHARRRSDPSRRSGLHCLRLVLPLAILTLGSCSLWILLADSKSINSNHPDPSEIIALAATLENTQQRHTRVVTSGVTATPNLLPPSPPGTLADFRHQPRVPLEPPVRLWNQSKHDYDLVHVILTRFQQHQADLEHLGRARWELFRTFCAPSLRAQTNQQFLWILRVDPDLSPALKRDLLRTVDGMDNVLVVASNGSQEDGLRNPHGNRDITQPNVSNNSSNNTTGSTSVWYGSVETFRSYQEASQTRMVLETNLDADDGLAVSFVETLQRQADATFHTTSHTGTTVESDTGSSFDPNIAWRIYCVNHHVTWQFWAPWRKTNDDTNNDRSTVTERGSLEAQHDLDICVTPGLTWASRPRTPQTFKYMRWHWRIRGTLPRCSDDHENNENNKNNRTTALSGCWSYVRPVQTVEGTSSVSQSVLSSVDFSPLAIRARTPTSAGMNDVATVGGTVSTSTARAKLQRQQQQDDLLWRDNVAETIFGGNTTTIVEARENMQTHLVDIVQDALQGQCTKGHSCHNKSKLALTRLLEQ